MILRRILAALVAFAAWAGPAAAKDDLTIGISAFTSTFHPSIDPLLVKTYILSMTRRPFTAYDKDWKVICMLCVELPTLENGKAKLETTADGKPGIAMTYAIQPGATWGDGTPVTTDDVLFTWDVGRNTKSGVTNIELFRRIVKIDVIDKK